MANENRCAPRQNTLTKHKVSHILWMSDRTLQAFVNGCRMLRAEEDEQKISSLFVFFQDSVKQCYTMNPCSTDAAHGLWVCERTLPLNLELQGLEAPQTMWSQGPRSAKALHHHFPLIRWVGLLSWLRRLNTTKNNMLITALTLSQCLTCEQISIFEQILIHSKQVSFTSLADHY